MSNQASATVDVPPDAEQDRAPSSTRPKKQPPYAVVLLNDDDHTFQYVMETLMKVFGYPEERCFQLTLEVHEQGRGIVWSGARELAELKRDQIHSAGADFHSEKKIEHPLGVTIEPLPG